MNITIGIDVGQRIDPTAFCVTEQVWRNVARPLPGQHAIEDHHNVRMLARLPLGTPYPEIVDVLAEVIKDAEELVRAGTLVNQAGRLEQEDFPIIKVFVDATGVGQPIVDMFRKVGVKVTGVYFTYGDQRKVMVDEYTHETRIQLGKAYMVSGLQALLQGHRIHLPDTEEAHVAERELLNYQIKVDENANERYGAFRVGEHDDLVTAIGLTTQEKPRLLSTASVSGHTPAQIPEWAGGDAPKLRETPGVLGGSTAPRLGVPGYHGRKSWSLGNTDSDVQDRLRRGF